MDLSIVIPAFEENKKIAADIKAAAAFFRKNRLQGEIIVVDDGSSDNTAEVAKKTAAFLPSEISLKVIRCDKHRGKGYAVRTGMKETSGEYVMFADSGCCVPYENTLNGLGILKNNICDIAHGSRKMQESIIQKAQSYYRQLCSAAFHWFLVHCIKIPAELTDTQCGFKIYRGQVARSLYSQCITDGFMFDVEIIMRAKKQNYRIKEFPIEWSCDPDSRLSPARSLRHILRELLIIKQNLAK